ncbi:MAG TPA: cation transporter, partial [Candidatus Omnitrophota bacterium]|nr:cation transporter [Candidatus Omnitrophota bacterium]
MSDCCTGCGCSGPPKPAVDPFFRRILWVALVLNGSMFFVEFAGGWLARSVSLTADSLDF